MRATRGVIVSPDERATLLEEAAKGGAGQDPSEKKIGDYYSACMDEAAVEKAGASPLRAGLDRIAKIKSQKDLADALAGFHAQGADMIFDFDSAQDAKDATQFIARADQGGIGLPDRDFYFQSDAKSAETRANYLAHVTKMFQLLGDSPDAAGKEAQTVMSIETALAKSSQTRVERRAPYAIYHKMTTAELAKLSTYSASRLPAGEWSAGASPRAPPIWKMRIAE